MEKMNREGRRFTYGEDEGKEGKKVREEEEFRRVTKSPSLTTEGYSESAFTSYSMYFHSSNHVFSHPISSIPLIFPFFLRTFPFSFRLLFFSLIPTERNIAGRPNLLSGSLQSILIEKAIDLFQSSEKADINRLHQMFLRNSQSNASLFC